jgi:hypothetical protein
VRHSLLLLVAGLALMPSPASAKQPAPPSGRLLVRGWERAWLVPAHGRVVPLSEVEAVSWSPALQLLGVTSRGLLTVRRAGGSTLWARTYSQLLGAPRWSSSHPVRLAFLAGRAIRLVDPRGRDERRLGRARDVAPAWRPQHDEIAFVRPGGDVVLVAARSGRTLARWHPPKQVAGLSWVAGGSRLVVSLRYAITVLDQAFRPQWTLRTRSILSAVAAPAGTLFGLATVRAKADGSQVTTVELRDAGRHAWHVRLARAYVLTGAIVWAPDGRSLMIERPLQRDWLLVDVATRRQRGLELPRSLRPVFGGIVAWFR